MSTPDKKIFYERRLFERDLLVYFEWTKPISASQWIVAWHGAEICFVQRGYVEHCFPSGKIRIHEGEIGLLNYLQPHRTIASAEGAFVSYNFLPADKGFDHSKQTAIFRDLKVSKENAQRLYPDPSFLENLISWLCQKEELITQPEIENIFANIIHDLTDSNDALSSDSGDANEHIKYLRDYLEDNFDKKVTLEDLANLSQLSRFHLLRLFKTHFGCTPIEYQQFIRLSKALQLLVSKPMPIDHVGSEVGFQDLSFFIRKFRSAYGKPPGQLNRSTNK